jgi:hypothetical protein
MCVPVELVGVPVDSQVYTKLVFVTWVAVGNVGP